MSETRLTPARRAELQRLADSLCFSQGESDKREGLRDALDEITRMTRESQMQHVVDLPEKHPLRIRAEAAESALAAKDTEIARLEKDEEEAEARGYEMGLTTHDKLTIVLRANYDEQVLRAEKAEEALTAERQKVQALRARMTGPLSIVLLDMNALGLTGTEPTADTRHTSTRRSHEDPPPVRPGRRLGGPDGRPVPHGRPHLRQGDVDCGARPLLRRPVHPADRSDERRVSAVGPGRPDRDAGPVKHQVPVVL